MNKKIYMMLISILILFGFSARLLPHPANFAPIGALAIFGGLYLPKKYALILPILALFLSDLFIGLYDWKIMLSVYLSFSLVILIGLFVKKHKNFTNILGGTILGSLIFFLITNASVWLFGTMHSHNLSGLIESYTMAIPFFRNSLLGDLFYTGILVGAAESITYLYKKTHLYASNKT